MEITNSYSSSRNLYELLKTLIHDLKSPLDNLMIWNEQISKNLPLAEKTSVMKSIKRIQDTLDSTSSELHNKQITIDLFNVNDLIKEILIEKIHEYRNRDIKILYKKAKNYKDINIKGSKSNFLRMLSNLINNAVEACGDKCGIIKIKLDRNNQEIILSIEDNGCGISKKVLKKLENGESLTYGKKNGNGIGMCQIRKTIQSLNGYLNIESKYRYGSKFIIRFII